MILFSNLRYKGKLKNSDCLAEGKLHMFENICVIVMQFKHISLSINQC